MAARKPKIEYYWVHSMGLNTPVEPVVYWRLVGANGETMCGSNQGFRDKTDARRSVEAVSSLLRADALYGPTLREVGPGKKPV